MTDTPEKQPQVTAPGQILKRARENRNLTVAAIATQMNLDLRTIEALEAGDQSKLPAPIFVRGYLRGYARLVGVSESELLELYQAQAPQEPTPRAVGRASAPLRPAFRVPMFPWRGLLLTVVLAALALLGFTYGPQLLRQFTAGSPVADGAAPDTVQPEDLSLPMPADVVPAVPESVPQSAPESVPESTPEPAPQTTMPETPAAANDAAPDASAGASGALELALPAQQPSVARDTAAQPVATPEPNLPGDGDFGTQTASPQAAPADAPAQPAPPATAATSTAQPALGELRLAFTFSAESWVEVRAADGSKLLFGLFNKGETREVSGEVPISVLLGNASGVDVRVNGKDFDLAPHSRDNIARFELKAAD